MYLFDTTVVSQLRKLPSGSCDESVYRWAVTIDLAVCYISAITILEIELGILQIERRDAQQGRMLRQWFDGLQHIYEGRVVPVDAAIAIRTAGLHIPDPKPERDAIIAASALVHGWTVVTRNIADFEHTGVLILNPWEF